MRGLVSSGSDKIVENIGRLPPDLFAETCQQIVNQLQGQTEAVDVPEICDKFQKAGVIVDLEDLEKIIKLLLFNFRSAAKKNLTGEELVSKFSQGSTSWPSHALQTVHRLWTEHSAQVRAHQEAQVMTSVGQLVDSKWKLGMAISSDTCRSLNSPYISLLLKMADDSGQITFKSFEMTIPQFQNFFRQFKEIAAILETV